MHRRRPYRDPHAMVTQCRSRCRPGLQPRSSDILALNSPRKTLGARGRQDTAGDGLRMVRCSPDHPHCGGTSQSSSKHPSGTPDPNRF
ncbi:MAG: hypothetical protein ACOYCB_13285, partial [Fastidiosipilaceae bacterium]